MVPHGGAASSQKVRIVNKSTIIGIVMIGISALNGHWRKSSFNRKHLCEFWDACDVAL
jgi:hypothetical protein